MPTLRIHNGPQSTWVKAQAKPESKIRAANGEERRGGESVQGGLRHAQAWLQKWWPTFVSCKIKIASNQQFSHNNWLANVQIGQKKKKREPRAHKYIPDTNERQTGHMPARKKKAREETLNCRKTRRRTPRDKVGFSVYLQAQLLLNCDFAHQHSTKHTAQLSTHTHRPESWVLCPETWDLSPEPSPERAVYPMAFAELE